jgi:hypothetical protein
MGICSSIAPERVSVIHGMSSANMIGVLVPEGVNAGGGMRHVSDFYNRVPCLLRSVTCGAHLGMGWD